MTATVETVSEQLDLAAIMPTEKVMSAVARAVTLSETDVGKKQIRLVLPFVFLNVVNRKIIIKFRIPCSTWNFKITENHVKLQ